MVITTGGYSKHYIYFHFDTSKNIQNFLIKKRCFGAPKKNHEERQNNDNSFFCVQYCQDNICIKYS